MDKPTLLLTRPAPSSVRFATRLDPALAGMVELCISPLLEIVAVPFIFAPVAQTLVVFTSVNGVEHGPKGEKRGAFCVGRQTADAAQAKGWHVCEMQQDAEALLSAMLESGVDGPLVHLSGAHQRGDIAERLNAAGTQTERIVVYDQRLLRLSNPAQDTLGGEGRVVVPLFSPRTAAQFAKDACELRRVQVIAMSNAVALELDGKPVDSVRVLAEPTGIEMVRTVELVLQGDRLP